MEEILRTLDGNGTLDQLPFMPEMLAHCGRRYRVSNRVVQAVIDGAALDHYTESYVRAFLNDDVVLLEDLRCSGAAHGGCQRGCVLFWKEAWLRKVDSGTPPGKPPPPLGQPQPPPVRSTSDQGRYFCQSTEFRNATRHLSGWDRVRNCWRAVWVGNCNPFAMANGLAVWCYWRFRQKLFGEWPRGHQTSTPVESLNLQPGEWVQVKPLSEIRKTLNARGRNRGLHFSPDMSRYCGQKLRVRSRAEPLITEVTGEVHRIQNTVILEGAVCDTATYAFGGCPRADFMYWREIWLRRIDAGGSPINSTFRGDQAHAPERQIQQSPG